MERKEVMQVTTVLKKLEKTLVRRIQIIVMLLGYDLGSRFLVARSEEGYNQAGELTFSEDNYVWKVGRSNTMQDIYFVLEFVPNLEDPKTRVALYHSLQNLVPMESRALQIDQAMPILTKGLTARYPVLKEPIDELISLVG